jgi:hypothetical protein
MITIIIRMCNTDAGIHQWNRSNLVMIVVYPLTIAVYCWYRWSRREASKL